MRTLIAAVACAVSLGACTTVGPDFRSPESSAPSQTGFVGANSPAFRADTPPPDWWRLFQDPVLDQLVTEALAANTDLRIAAANLEQARAALQEVRANRLPSTAVGAGAQYGRGSAAPLGLSEAPEASDTYDFGLDIGYQVDLFGRIRRAIEASTANAESVAAARDLVAISVAAETARAYADICSAGAQLEVARRSVEVQGETLQLTQRLFIGGRATALDVARAGALLDQTRSTLPLIDARRRTSLHRLSVLTGRPPAEVPVGAGTCVAAPILAQPIPVGEGAGLLARRPDVRQAERRLAAATAQVGVATADLYPTVSFGLSVGSTAKSVGDLGSDRALRYSLGPLIQWTFPNRTVARARIAQAEAGVEGALAAFEGAWLRALQETESALTLYANELDRNQSLRSARQRSAEAAQMARLRYNAGADSFLSVLDAERTLTQAEATLAESDAQVAAYQVAVFLALGGGWEVAVSNVRDNLGAELTNRAWGR